MKSRKSSSAEYRKSLSKTIAFDLDDVLCHRPKHHDNLDIDKYYGCKPNRKMIKIVNKLWEQGFTIKIYTSRGMTSLKGDVNEIYSKLYELTTDCLKQWRVKYDVLVMGKLHYDLLVDDKAINSSDVRSINDILKHL